MLLSWFIFSPYESVKIQSLATSVNIYQIHSLEDNPIDNHKSFYNNKIEGKYRIWVIWRKFNHKWRYIPQNITHKSYVKSFQKKLLFASIFFQIFASSFKTPHYPSTLTYSYHHHPSLPLAQIKIKVPTSLPGIYSLQSKPYLMLKTW